MPEDCPDASKHLAELLGLDLATFVELLGSGWHALSGDDSLHDDDAVWWVTGEPVQLLLQAKTGRRAVLLAVPVGVWRSHRLVHVAGRTEEVSPADAPARTRATAGQLLRARRSSFRYCRYCRSLTPPEYRHRPDVCMGCSERWLGVVH